MYHSIIFQYENMSRNTWNNWHLIPTSLPVVSRPTPNYKFIDIPGRDGSIDLTDFLIGRPYYSDCTGSFEFLVANDYGRWVDRKSEISSFLNGRKMKMTLEDDPQYYYLGRFYMDEWSPGASNSTVTISYRVEPYKIRSNNGEKVWA